MLAPMPPEDVSHRQIWVQLTELAGKIDGIHSLLTERKEDHLRIRRDVDGLFDRVRRVESRLAQVVILGVVLGILSQAFGQALQFRLLVPAAIERQEVRK